MKHNRARLVYLRAGLPPTRGHGLKPIHKERAKGMRCCPPRGGMD